MSNFESAVLGAIMLDRANYWLVADTITAEDFTGKANREIFECLAELIKAGKEPDPIFMLDALPEHGAYCVQISQEAIPTSAKHYAERIKDDSERRKVKAAGQRIALGSHTYIEAQSILSDVSPKDSKSTKHIRDYLGEMIVTMQERCESDGTLAGVPTSLDGLDRVTNGLKKGALCILAARPGMGKSALAMQIAISAAVHTGRVAVFSLEMSGMELAERAVSFLGGVQGDLIQHPKSLREEHWPKVFDASKILEDSGLLIDETGAQTKESIGARLMQLHMQEPLTMAVIDHLGLMDIPDEGNAANAIGKVTKYFKQLSKRLGIPILLLVQLNRSLEQRADKRPLLSDLRDSGRIEEDADVVLMIYRDDYYNKESQQAGYAEILVRKNRGGRAGMVPTRVQLDLMRFSDVESIPAIITDTVRTNARFGRFADRKTAAAGDD